MTCADLLSHVFTGDNIEIGTLARSFEIDKHVKQIFREVGFGFFVQYPSLPMVALICFDLDRHLP